MYDLAHNEFFINVSRKLPHLPLFLLVWKYGIVQSIRFVGFLEALVSELSLIPFISILNFPLLMHTDILFFFFFVELIFAHSVAINGQ
jgi:hypothetical protein